jgi:hypothetical protein
MPASILTSLLLWSTLFLPGASAGLPSHDGFPNSPKLSVARTIDDHEFLIRPCSFDSSNSWTMSEADTEEEDSREGDDLGIISRGVWNSSRPGRIGHTFVFRPDTLSVCFAFRSPILRC